MTNKLNPKIVSLSLASVSGVLYILCAIFFAIAPQATLDAFSNIFHGIDITQIAKTTVSFGSTIIGFIEIIVYSLVAGWIFAVIYNYLLAKIR